MFFASPEAPRPLEGVQKGKELLLFFGCQLAKALGNHSGFTSVTQDCILQR
jgi:hypothetical protein